ncbi:MAG: PAS domain S-box protein, partial [Akkermansiaceae bacterium]|nr:PAS domain S-box protein [Verrucomicrobiales bacterium]
MRFEARSIRRKITAAIMLTSLTVVLLTVAVFMIHDLTTIRRNTIRDFSTLARIIAWNSTAALAFRNENDAREVLSSLAAEPQILSAALYDAQGQLFATYHHAKSRANNFPVAPEPPGHQIERSHILFFESVAQGNTRFGTLYLQADLKFFYTRLQLYALLAGFIIMGSVAVSLVLSHRLQRNVSDPILALTGTARRISEFGDYSVRAPRVSQDELGLLTDAFNQMLTRIQEQTVAIQESENRLRLALEASRIGIWDWNIVSGHITWDERNAALFGLKPDEFRGTFEHFLKLVQEHNHDALSEALRESLDKKTDFTAEFQVVWADNSVHDMLARGRALYDDAGKPVRMTGITQDITQRKQTEEASRRLAAIVESSDDAIVGKTLAGIVTSWNKAAERMFGYTSREMVGSTIERINVPEAGGFEQQVLDTVRRGETSAYETQRLRKNGSRVDVSLTVSPIRTADGTIVGASAISRDITDRKLAERQLEESRARLSGVITSAM